MDEMNEDISLGMAVELANGHDLVAQVKADLQLAYNAGQDLPVSMIRPLIAVLEAQEKMINAFYEVWAVVGDSIQKEQ